MTPAPTTQQYKSEEYLNLLRKVGHRLTSKWVFLGSKWQNAESETIAYQAIVSCHHNLNAIGESMSWYHKTLLTENRLRGALNASGLRTLVDDGSIVVEEYHGDLQPPDNTLMSKSGAPMVLRVTPSLLNYALVMLK